MTQFPTNRVIRIATRASQLALWQAHHIADKIRELNSNLVVEIIQISTQGDRETAAPLWQMGGLGVFTSEVQKVVLNGEADLAVHSLKDLPTEPTSGLTLAAIPERADQYDVLVLPLETTLSYDLFSPYNVLDHGALVGTGSLRRRAQINHYRPDITFNEVRGNVDTRLKKLDQGECQALILAAAGLTRLNLAHRISLKLTPPWMYPAVGQGALGLECRADDKELSSLLNSLNHQPSQIAVTVERALLNALRAGCHAPVGVNVKLTNSQIMLEAIILSKTGSIQIKAREEIPITHYTDLAPRLAEKLNTMGSQNLLH